MYRGKFDEELKADFFKAFLAHRDEGCRVREAYRKAREDFLNAHKLAPSLATFTNWYNAAMGRKKRAENAGTPAVPEKEERGEGLPSEASAAEGPTEPAAAVGETDYTARLEMIVRLYRTRSEGAIDALCDYLLPELAGETEAQ